VQGLDDALLSIVKRDTHVADAAGQRFISHDDVGPDRLNELVLRYQPARVLDEIAQNLEALRPQLDLAIVRAEAASPQIELVSLEAKGLCVGRLHRSTTGEMRAMTIAALFPCFCSPPSRHVSGSRPSLRELQASSA
jgi:hypothetical protein